MWRPLGAPQIACIFNRERNEMLQTLAVTGLKLYFLACPFIGFNIVPAIYFASTERPCPAQIISFLRIVCACAGSFPAFRDFKNDRAVACLSDIGRDCCNGWNVFYILEKRKEKAG